jgi:hypothetical protein
MIFLRLIHNLFSILFYYLFLLTLTARALFVYNIILIKRYKKLNKSSYIILINLVNIYFNRIS